jgi:hypothetical protein
MEGISKRPTYHGVFYAIYRSVSNPSRTLDFTGKSPSKGTYHGIESE